MENKKEPITWEEVEKEEELFQPSPTILFKLGTILQNNKEIMEKEHKKEQQKKEEEEALEVLEDPLGIINTRLEPSQLFKNLKNEKEENIWSIFFTQEDFNPQLYLSIIHKDTSFSKLKVLFFFL